MRWIWRNRIVTLLIGRSGTSRRLIHKTLMRVYTPTDEARIDRELSLMVKRGDLLRPRKGVYEIAPPQDMRPAS